MKGYERLIGSQQDELDYELREKLDIFGISPREKIGQHFLIDRQAIELISNQVTDGNMVIEVGAGPGQLTEALADKAEKVVAVEIDRRFEPFLAEITRQHPNTKVVFGDALKVKYEEVIESAKKNETGVQVVANLPFHITEPFLYKMAGLPLENLVLLVGERLAYSIKAKNEDDIDFTNLSLLVQTFFRANVVVKVDKSKFYPKPRTDSAIIILTPHEEADYLADKRLYILRRLFKTRKERNLSGKVIVDGLVGYTNDRVAAGKNSKAERHRHSRRSIRSTLKGYVDNVNSGDDVKNAVYENHNKLHYDPAQVRRLITNLGLNNEILNAPFDQLNNSQLRGLSKALRGIS